MIVKDCQIFCQRLSNILSKFDKDPLTPSLLLLLPVPPPFPPRPPFGPGPAPCHAQTRHHHRPPGGLGLPLGRSRKLLSSRNSGR